MDVVGFRLELCSVFIGLYGFMLIIYSTHPALVKIFYWNIQVGNEENHFVPLTKMLDGTTLNCWIFKQILNALVEFLSLVINKDPMLEAIMQVAATESIIQEEDGLLCRRNQQETGRWFHYWDSALLSNWKVCFLCFYLSYPSLVSQSTLSFSNS